MGSLVSTQDVFLIVACKSLALPAVFAKKQDLKTLVFIYTFTISFSIMHHISELPALYWVAWLIDIADFLKFFAYHGITLSVVYTLLAISEYPPDIVRLHTTSMGISAVVRLKYSFEGAGTFSIPVIMAVISLAVSWGFKSYEKKGLFPEFSVWRTSLLPGFGMGALAIIFRDIVEKSWKQKVAHAFFHIILSLSFVLLLQCKNKKEQKNTTLGENRLLQNRFCQEDRRNQSQAAATRFKKLPNGSSVLHDAFGCCC